MYSEVLSQHEDVTENKKVKIFSHKEEHKQRIYSDAIDKEKISKALKVLENV